jgi:N-acetylneuraminic acid mutarotase
MIESQVPIGRDNRVGMRRKLLASCSLIIVSAAVLLGARVSAVEATSTGVWSAGASLVTGRGEHTATLLRNGTILVAGGTDGRGKALASAEVYNPKTNQWAPGGTMMATRLDFTATILANGKVLVVGGQDQPFPSTSLASAELYDPTTNSWLPAAPMSAGRARHSATGLPDGRVLVVGGQSFTLRGGGIFENQPVSAEVFDPATNGWSPTSPMSTYRLGQTATLLRDGRVLVAGGTDGIAPVRSAEIYDPKQDRWTAAASMTTALAGHTATLLPNGDVLVIGHVETDALGNLIIPLSSAEVYDPRVDRWSAVAGMRSARDGDTATLLSSGTVLVVGDTRPGSRAEIYDPVRNTWSTVSGPMDRSAHTATRLPDGRVLLIGGYRLESLNSVLLYDPTATPRGPGEGTNRLVVAGLLLAAFLVLLAAALSLPTVRRRLKVWRRRNATGEWIG